MHEQKIPPTLFLITGECLRPTHSPALHPKQNTQKGSHENTNIEKKTEVVTDTAINAIRLAVRRNEWAETPQIHFDRHASRFIMNGRPHPGLLKKLKRVFYPTYTFAAHAPKQVTRVHVSGGNPNPHHHQEQPPKNNDCRGVALGRRVDEEMTTVVSLCYLIQNGRKDQPNSVSRHQPTRRWYHAMPTVHLLLASGDHLVKVGMTPAMILRIISAMKCLTTHTKSAIQDFARRGWFPVASQVPVGCHVIGVCTAIDVLCEDHSSLQSFNANAQVAVEVKTGFEYNYDSATHCLGHPFTDKMSSPASHHQLQLLFTVFMALVNEYPRGRGSEQAGCITRAVILLIGRLGCRVLSLQDWAASCIESAVSTFALNGTRGGLPK